MTPEAPAVGVTEFLLARIAEDEAKASPRRAATQGAWHDVMNCEWADGNGHDCTCGYPARVLADCEAKRIIANVAQALDVRLRADEPGSPQWHEATAYLTVVQTLATSYADHPDYREDWRI
jgi:hypothetical protein